MVLILSDAPPAARTPWLPFQGPIPPIRGKCPEGTKGVGMLSAQLTERLSQVRLNLSVSAAPSHLPWKGRPNGSTRTQDSPCQGELARSA